jgi:predicted HTH domain antitoxin
MAILAYNAIIVSGEAPAARVNLLTAPLATWLRDQPWLESLSRQALMANSWTGNCGRYSMQITVTLPENQFKTDIPDRIAAKIRLYAALGMYQAGELSIGAACELAGMDRYTFLETMKQKGVRLQTQTPDEIEADYRRLADTL